MPETETKPRDTDCSVCAAPDFRNCPCPWHLPFCEWRGTPKVLLEKALSSDD